MNLLPDCVPCTLQKVIRLIRMKAGDETRVREGVEEFIRVMQTPGIWNCPPMTLATLIYRRIRPIIGTHDFLRDEKQAQNREALALLEKMRGKVCSSEDPLKFSLLLATVGNIIDMGAAPEYDLLATLEGVMAKGFARDDYPEMAERLRSANSLMLIADNAGEVVLDLFFLSLVPVPKRMICVRNTPFLNDAMASDLEGLPYVDDIEVITTGSDTLGVNLEDSSDEFREIFRETDIIIAKGQANLESLMGRSGREVFFASMIKCDPLARFLGVERGSAVLFLGHP
ncbi:MAG: ARMT1-like domain-containing protein [candidate division WOR-3 bacterium]